MGLRIADDDRPGYALLDFGRDTGPGDAFISLQSKLFIPGEFLSPAGDWSKSPHFFKAVRLPAAGPGVYRVGPEIVNQQDLANDTIEVRVRHLNLAEETRWPELTPAVFGGGHAGVIYRPPSEEESDEPQPVLEAQSTEPLEEPLEKAAQEPMKKEAQAPIEHSAQEATKGPIKTGANHIPVWWVVLAIAVPVFVLVVASQFYCLPLPVLHGNCVTRTASLADALNCAQSKGPQSSCDAALCFDAYFASNPPAGEERLHAERLKGMLDMQCRAKRASFQQAKACAEQKRLTDPCAAQHCFDNYLSDLPASESDRETAEALARGLSTRCSTMQDAAKRDKEAADKARTCISQRRGPPCGETQSCVNAYIKASPAGSYEGELRQLVRDTEDRCNMIQPPSRQRTGPFPTSFSCLTARQNDEQAVCNDETLASLDVQLQEVYSSLRNRLRGNSDLDSLIREQRVWLARRASCGAEVRCLASLYSSRISQLRNR